MNSKRGGVEFEADGKTYVLRLTTNAQVRYGDAMGKTLIAALQDMRAGEVDVKILRAMFRYGLTPEVSDEDAGTIMDEVGIMQAAKLIGQAALLAFPVPAGANGAVPAEDPQVAPPLPTTTSSISG